MRRPLTPRERLFDAVAAVVFAALIAALLVRWTAMTRADAFAYVGGVIMVQPLWHVGSHIIERRKAARSRR